MKALGFYTIAHKSRLDEFTVWNLSDLHVGARACAEEKIRRDVKKILADPNAVWFGGGDTIDGIAYNDKRFSPSCVAPWIRVKDMGNLGKVCVDRVVDILSPIKHKCLGMMQGNHEASMMLHTQNAEIHQSLCKGLGVIDMGYSCIFDIKFCRNTKTRNKVELIGWNRPMNHVLNELHGTDRKSYSSNTKAFRFYCHHGSGGAVTTGGKLNRLLSFMNMVDADIVMMGHVHEQQGTRQHIMSANSDCTDIQTKEKIGVVSGSYLKTYHQDSTTYGEIKGYRPTVLGASFVRIRPETRELRGEV